MSVRRRRASHTGSWYDSSPDKLRKLLSAWLSAASHGAASSTHPLPSELPVYAVIAPHAGYSYSGKTAAYAYAPIDVRRFSRVFVLGPSHHVYLQDRCAVSDAHLLETPLGELAVDREVVDGLLENADGQARFVRMSEDMDEAEHSIEMHLPYIRHVFARPDVKVVPIVVGSLSEEKERHFGRVLSSWIGDGETFFVISSDFCHWGTRFRYTRVDRQSEYIWQSIERMDREGMSIIESGDHAAFCSYLRRTENTICGRHPIGVLLSALSYCSRHSERAFSIRFARYEQSSKCESFSDSSVSYASALVQTSGTPVRASRRHH